MYNLIAVAMNDPVKFKESTIDIGSDMILSSRFFKVAIFANILIGFFLIYWWLSQDYSSTWFNANGEWDLFGVYSNASTITQWGVVIIIGMLLNKYLFKKFGSI